MGGVLEHPYGSLLWAEMDLPMPGSIDEFGGFTLLVNQSWFGHKAQKRTLLYIVGGSYKNLPPIPISFDAIQYVIRPSRNGKGANIVTKKEREATPVDFAKWLINVAKSCKKNEPKTNIPLPLADQ